MTTTYAGIDYGRGLTNINTKTGIRYGVIGQNEVLQAWADSSEPQYTYYCPHCGHGPLAKGYDAKRCPKCYKAIKESDFDFQEPDGFTYEQDGYVCTCGEDRDIFITKSPYYTYSQLCSPCAPGAGYIIHELEDRDPRYRAYCLGHDWFEDQKAPYTVYSVETNEIVLPA